MRKQTILSIAIISMLPLTINGASGETLVETNTPTRPGKGEDTYIATDEPPYAVAEITNDDATHIASTAYVKGAYNDAIAGMNKAYDSLQYHIDNKQSHLYYIDNDVQQGISSIVKTDLSQVTTNYHLVTGLAVKNAIAGVNGAITNTINTVNNTISNKRVDIYTTWDDDTATQQVGLTTYEKPKD